MGKANFTPGPWFVDFENCGGGYTISSAAVGHIVHTNEISRINSTTGKVVGMGEARANARMAAAAPNLFAALDRLLAETVDMDIKYGISLTEGEESAREQALSAIAEATGE